MTKVGRAWFECSVTTCEASTLVTRAEKAGWFVGTGSLQLCQVHRHMRDPQRLDASQRAAGEGTVTPPA